MVGDMTRSSDDEICCRHLCFITNIVDCANAPMFISMMSYLLVLPGRSITFILIMFLTDWSEQMAIQEPSLAAETTMTKIISKQYWVSPTAWRNGTRNITRIAMALGDQEQIGFIVISMWHLSWAASMVAPFFGGPLAFYTLTYFFSSFRKRWELGMITTLTSWPSLGPIQA